MFAMSKVALIRYAICSNAAMTWHGGDYQERDTFGAP